MLVDVENLVKDILDEPWAKMVSDKGEFWSKVMVWMEQHLLADFLTEISDQIDEIVEIDPDLPEPSILEKATEYMVQFLGAQSASVRIYDPQTEQMLSYGSYPSKEESRATVIPLEGSIAGDVVKTGVPRLVPNIMSEERYLDKEVISKSGVQSLMAIPLELSRFFPTERNTVGVVQIYYDEKDRAFTTPEVQVAAIMAKRLSYVIARKKILSMNRHLEKREVIVQHIFSALGSRGGLKMKEVFNSVMPELADMVNLQSCALFSISDDLNYVILEAGYPQKSYHSVGEIFPVSSEPAFEVLLNMRDYEGDSVYEVVRPDYIQVMEPKKTEIISDNLKRFAAQNNINSILYMPLGVEGEITHFLTFDALDQKERYRDDEIEIFLFLGRELMKAEKIERLDDALHDFKNPAIATAGFARRLKKLVDTEWDETSREQIRKYADILLEETSRLQELALSIYQVGEEQIVNISEVLQMRAEINREAIKEQLKQNVTIVEGPFESDLKVKCYRIHIERIFDNLLNNSTKAIPFKGGTLSITTYSDGGWACAEISNTGEISQEVRSELLEGGAEGRGLYITQRIVRLLKGNLEIKGGKGMTTIVVKFPLHDSSKKNGPNQLSLLENNDSN
ncbi:GAF domain-containing protein [Thermodesulfobacteriota bacterium]